MAVFVRRTTAFLLFLLFILSIACVALLVLLLGPEKTPMHDHEKHEKQIVHSSGEGKNPPFPDEAEMLQKSSASSKMETTTSESSPSDDDIQKLHPWEKHIRLPTTTIPYHYDLLLHPNLQTGWFEGKVSILIGVTSPMDYLLTHVKLMNVTSTTLISPSGLTLDLEGAFEFEPNQFWVVRPKQILNPGNYTLSLSFNGGLKGHIVGFYMSEYMTKSGEKRSIATSKFQPTDARRAFPCFDEPSFKSTFNTTLVRPSEGYVALSNMPVQKEMPNIPSSGLTTVKFEKSVPMVTYLACFIICDFEYVEVMTKDNKPFRVYATSDQIERAHYARDIGVHILNYFESYFEVEYPLPKQDMIAIPDFVSGAMEHWGLITYRETNLLYDDTNSSSYNKQRVAVVVSHELAHMWFGNLVTLKWWDDLWLNEGFASYIEYKGVANYEKDWDMLAQFLSSDLHSVFALDQILSSHPIVQTVNHPDEITEIFDKISYSKGAAVLRMLENFMGAEPFRIGVRNFLQKFKYRNAVTQDLWDEFQKVSQNNLDITRIMDTWTKQMGFPLLTVSRSTGNKTKLEVRQERFLADPDAKSKEDSPFHYKWDVPVTLMTDETPRQQQWMKMEDEMILLDIPANAKWVKLNVDQYGYYRVNYEEEMWADLITALRNNLQVLSASDRANLIDDGFTLAAKGTISYNLAFDIISYLPNETHYVPWSSTYIHLKRIAGLLYNTQTFKYFRRYVVSLVDKHVTRVGWEDTGTHLERRNRGVILKLACDNGHEGCKKGAVEKFQSWIQDSSSFIPANLRSLVYIHGISETGEKEWDVLFDRFQKELNAQEKIKMLRGLTSTKDLWIASRLLELGRNVTVIRKQDFFTMMSYLAYNPSTLPTVWNFLRSNWEWMVEEFGLNNRYLGRVVKTIGEQFVTPLHLEEIKTFFKTYPDAGSGKRARLQALEKIEQNIKWLDSYTEPLHMWLKKTSM